MPKVRESKMERLTWPELDSFLKSVNNPGIIIPIGPVEEHGPWLPVSTDIVSATRVAEIVAEKTENVLVFPAIPLMCCGISRDTSGTYPVQPGTLKLIALDLLRHFCLKGFKRVVFFSGHGGYSTVVIEEAISVVKGESSSGELLAYAHNFNTVADELQFALVDNDTQDVHAGGIETSRVMVLAPEILRSGPYRADYHDRSGDKLILSKSGISGDPARASRENGLQIIDATVSRLLEYFV